MVGLAHGILGVATLPASPSSSSIWAPKTPSEKNPGSAQNAACSPLPKTGSQSWWWQDQGSQSSLQMGVGVGARAGAVPAPG